MSDFEELVWELSNAVQQMKEDWAESNEVHKNELWARVHRANAALRDSSLFPCRERKDSQ